MASGVGLFPGAERVITMAERVGFIGLGIMGKPMVRNLVKAGFEVVVHSRTRASVDQMGSETGSGIAADSAADVTRQVKTVVTMLPDSPDVREATFGANGILEAF